MTSSFQPAAHCPHCSAEIRTYDGRCWLCGWSPAAPAALGSTVQASPVLVPPPQPRKQDPFQFSLASLFLAMTLVAVALGVFMIAPGLGVLMVIVATPALIRTMIAASYRRQAGAPLTPLEKAGTFLLSWFIMGAIGVAAFVAFMAACAAGVLVTSETGRQPGGREEVMWVINGVIAGLIAAIPLTVWLLRLTRPTKTVLSKGSDRQ